MLSRECLCNLMTEPWRQATSFPMIDFEDNFGITMEHYRHCRRFCDGQTSTFNANQQLSTRSVQ